MELIVKQSSITGERQCSILIGATEVSQSYEGSNLLTETTEPCNADGYPSYGIFTEGINSFCIDTVETGFRGFREEFYIPKPPTSNSSKIEISKWIVAVRKVKKWSKEINKLHADSSISYKFNI